MKVYIVYDSEGGHTEILAKAIAEGAESVANTQVYLKHISESQPEDLAEMDAVIWGCPDHFGTISANLKKWIDNLGNLWAEGKLIDKVGAVFCTTATVHGGTESTLLNLLTPMLHQGMLIVGLPGTIPENALYGSYYGVGITCPVENTSDSPPNMPSESDLALGRALGRRVAETVQKFHA
ncbi:NAD(P)H-dependent oxidoreductase [Desulfosporosinus sp. PR]|uniref:NAD(P)H-dependent oxidoreductase n=1 Tax=Candidatus Desulfosporosinus nitrosoreducens TaxID=3401928 RepID=UPI0027EC65DB|nr:NAD(P)H-dependent oxidoreductase [Desulfosporosinus sp. PR]MDQ7095927.1 NAD(P)H-dependent oxidoreductase [Desulfosporosinus sp. PR]